MVRVEWLVGQLATEAKRAGMNLVVICCKFHKQVPLGCRALEAHHIL